jgi:hypothetical protein
MRHHDSRALCGPFLSLRTPGVVLVEMRDEVWCRVMSTMVESRGVALLDRVVCLAG